MWVLVHGRLVLQLQRRKAGPNSPTSSLSAGNKHQKWSHACWVSGPALPNRLSLSSSSFIALRQGPGAALLWTWTTAMLRVTRVQAQRKPVSSSSSDTCLD